MGATRNTGSLSRTLWTGANGNHLQINPWKAPGEVVVDFPTGQLTPSAPVNVQEMDLEIVDPYKFPGCSPEQ